MNLAFVVFAQFIGLVFLTYVVTLLGGLVLSECSVRGYVIVGWLFAVLCVPLWQKPRLWIRSKVLLVVCATRVVGWIPLSWRGA